MLYRDCQFESLKEGAQCARCGYQLRRTFDTTPKRNCKNDPGLGDRLSDAMAAVWITERNWLRLKAWFWKTVTGKEVVVTCGCSKRIERLNAWGRWLASWHLVINSVIRKVILLAIRTDRTNRNAPTPADLVD
jgi:hypothetical protein